VDADTLIVPRTVVRLRLNRVTKAFVADLLATRSTRDLQTVRFGWIDDANTASLLGELVSTDPNKQWTLNVVFKEQKAAAAFCRAATDAHTTARPSSLTDLTVSGHGHEHVFASLLAAVPTIKFLECLLLVVLYERWRHCTSRDSLRVCTLCRKNVMPKSLNAWTRSMPRF
jgi:hypothetical protein